MGYSPGRLAAVLAQFTEDPQARTFAIVVDGPSAGNSRSRRR
jgi:hypothetical protein